MVRSLLLMPALLSVVLTAAADEDEAVTIQHPFLWEFQRDASDVTSYLFGTIHVNDRTIKKDLSGWNKRGEFMRQPNLPRNAAGAILQIG